MGFLSGIKNLFSRKRAEVRLGLALGSGGAKGMAHLGALKAFEEEGLKFSVVTGTSIGAIVGALYAKGYSSADMVAIVENVNRKQFSKNLRPYADIQFAEDLLEQYLEGDISELPVPFGCFATDAESNEGVALTSGQTARAVSASSAIPPFFRAVEIDGRKLYDGAFSNQMPADLCKELGAQFVVAIDLSAFTAPEEEKGMFARFLGNALVRLTPVKYLPDNKSRGYDAADFVLRPNLKDHRATDVSVAGMDAVFEIGYEEAKNMMPSLKEALRGAGVVL